MSEYYVSPLGNDAWSGRAEDSAFATLDAAIKAMAADAGDVTYVLDGHYYLNGSGVALTNANSNATITAYPGANPVISGGTAIPASSWSIGADGIWTAEVGSDDIGQLTVDGERQTLARFPNTAPNNPNRSGWLWAQALPDGGNPLRQLAYNPADFPIGQNPTVGQQATVFDANNWSNNILKIAAVDTTSHVITFDGAATYYVGPGSRYFISGSKPLLDQPGEWYLDHATGIIYFNPPSGFNGAGAVVSGNLSLIDISHAENITISGLTFSDAATNAQNEALINTAAVNVNASVGISITGNHFINVARGVHIGGNSNGNLVSNNNFSNIWGQSVSLARGTSHNRVDHNAIENSGDVFAAASAIQLNNASNNIVSNNHIMNVPRSGISAIHSDASVQSGANVIEHNTILHSGQATDDSGAIYIASPGVSSPQPDTIRSNTIDDAGGLGTTNGGFISRQNASAGIYVDVGLIGTKISGNVIQGATLGGVYLHGSSNNDVHGNDISADHTPSDSNEEIDVSLVPISGMAMGGNTVHDNAFSSSESPANSATDSVADSDSNGSSVGGAAVEADGTSDRPIGSVDSGPPLSVGAGATAEIEGASAQSVIFAGSTGSLILDDALAFTGQVSGLAGSDGIDLADVSYGSDTEVTFLGNTDGGTLTITNGTQTANIALVGDYLSSYWTLSNDGNGGTLVVDPTSSNTWQPVNIGAGGYLTGLDVAPDGTMVVRTDTYGAYLWNGSQWQQLVTSSSMPSAFVTPNLDGQGVYEIQIASSNSNIMYMMFDGDVFKTTNKGTTWTETAFAQVSTNIGDIYRGWGQKMAIDPNDPNTVYVGTPLNGLFVTTNGGTSWQSVSGVPAGVVSNGDSPGITGLEFDPANTNVIFAASYGNGVYETTNAGASWSILSGGPGSVQYATISSTGVYYAVGDNNSDLWSYANGAWKELLTGQIDAVAISPSNPNEIVVANGTDQLNESLNGGTSWEGWTSNATLGQGDTPWLSVTAPYLSASALAFNPLEPNEILATGQNDFWTTTVPQTITSTTPIVWTSQGVGIEQLVANEIIVPPGGDPVVASWDRGIFYISNAQDVASTFGPVDSSAISAGWSINYASSDPSFLVEISDGAYVDSTTELSGYSTNGGQTWIPFPTDPPGVGTGGAYTGPWAGSIAASTPDNILWAPANNNQPYYTLDGGETWNPVVLPGVSSWANFQGAWYSNDQDVTADRVLPNTFYLVADRYGVYVTTNGGTTWTLASAASSTTGLFYWSGGNKSIQSVPGEAGNLFYSPGIEAQPNDGFYQSSNGGVTWNAVANVNAVDAFGFGAAAPGQSYPAIYIAGWVNNVYGIWQSINDAQSWTQIGTYPNGDLDLVKTISGNPNVYGQVYVGFAGSGYAYLSADGPSVAAIATSPASGLEEIGSVVTLTLAMSEVVTVAGGTPTLTLDDGGTATYTGGSGTDALTFSYTVAAGQNAAALAATAANLNGAAITDSGGNAANLSLSGLPHVGPQIESAPSAVTAVTNSVSSGVLEAGGTTTLTLQMSEAVTVNTTGGTPALTLNDGGTATYAGGSGTNALTFSYTAAAGQSISSLAATAVDLNGATIANLNGNANLSLSGLTQTGPQVVATPTLAIDGNNTSVTSWATSASVTLTTSNPNEVIILYVNDGTSVSSVSDTTGLTWQLRAVAGGFSEYYAIASNELSADAITVNFTGSTDSLLNAFSIVGANTSSPFDTNTSVAHASTGSTISTNNAHDLILAAFNSYAATAVSAGSGWTTISDPGGDSYLSEYKTVSSTQSGLAATLSSGGNTIGTEIVDAVVQATTPTTTGPTVSSVVESSPSGNLDAGKIVTLTLNLSEAVTVAGGTPTLTLNDGGTATYGGGSGTSALTFSYAVVPGQNTSAITATEFNLNSATIKDAAGNVANLSLSGLTQSGPQIDTTPPAAPVITNDTVNADDSVTLTGSAEANSTIHVLNGTDVLGTTTTNASGSWSFTTGELTAGSYTFTATTTDAAGNTSAVSSGIDPTIGLPAAPAIVSFSPDTGPAAADVTNAKILTLTGTAPAASTVEVYDGSTELGTTTANAAGTWSYTTGGLADGAHSFTATDTVAVNVSAASAALTVTVDTIAPAASQIANDTVNANDSVTLSGTAAANSTLNLFDGSTELGTTTANGSGTWSYTTGTLGNGGHSFTATDTDVAGNVSVASAAVIAGVGSVAPTAPIIVNDTVSASDTVTLGGTAEANSTINVFDGSSELGTTTASGNGAWSYTTAALANGAHSFTATDVIGSEVSAASAALAVTLSAAATTPARNHAGRGWARGSHAPIGKFIDKATLDDIFGTSSTTVSHHAGDLSASDPTVNATTNPSENLDSTSPATFTHTDIFHTATDTNSDGRSNQNNAPDTAVNGSHAIGALDGSPNPHWTEANAGADSDATRLLNGSAEGPVEWHHNHSSAWQSGNWVSAEGVSGDIHPPPNAALHSIFFHDATDTNSGGTSNQSNAPDTAVNENHAVSALDGSPNPHWTEADTTANSDPASPPSGSTEAPDEWHHDHSSAWQSGGWVSTAAVSGDTHPALSAAFHSIAAGGASLNFAGLVAEVSDAFVFKSDLGNEPVKHLTTALDQINPHDLFEHIIEIHADLHAAAIDNVPEPIDPSASHLNTLHLHSFHVG